jgi:hypothetical protein
MYEKSFMHRDAVTHVAVGAHDFIMTGSADGDLRFWKKTPVWSSSQLRQRSPRHAQHAGIYCVRLAGVQAQM